MCVNNSDCLFTFDHCDEDNTVTFRCIYCERKITINNQPWNWLNLYTEDKLNGYNKL